jgi:hypothetical protein
MRQLYPYARHRRGGRPRAGDARPRRARGFKEMVGSMPVGHHLEYAWRRPGSSRPAEPIGSPSMGLCLLAPRPPSRALEYDGCSAQAATGRELWGLICPCARPFGPQSGGRVLGDTSAPDPSETRAMIPRSTRPRAWPRYWSAQTRFRIWFEIEGARGHPHGQKLGMIPTGGAARHLRRREQGQPFATLRHPMPSSR